MDVRCIRHNIIQIKMVTWMYIKWQLLKYWSWFVGDAFIWICKLSENYCTKTFFRVCIMGCVNFDGKFLMYYLYCKKTLFYFLNDLNELDCLPCLYSFHVFFLDLTVPFAMNIPHNDFINLSCVQLTITNVPLINHVSMLYDIYVPSI